MATDDDTGNRIRVLPAIVANQIAAGEVVERPSSVVKELVENALDAGATKLRVEIEGGGIGRVRVIDDGYAMSPEDARLALRRHATSKIRSAADLHSIRSLGFRGEALPSIASVSHFVLRTRRQEDDDGFELHVEGGAEPSGAPCGCAAGTMVEVAELFFNVPARRKFLRALATESAHVTEIMVTVALAHPETSVTLVRDGRVAREWLHTTGRHERVRAVLAGYELTTCLGQRGPVSIEAHLTGPERVRTGATGLRIFINGRPVQDRALSRAIAAAYGPALDHGRYPVGAVFIEMPTELVDVNVHPQKAQVRFAHARAVTDALFSVVRERLQQHLGVGGPTSDPAAADGPPAWRGRDGEPSASWVWSEPGAPPHPAGPPAGPATDLPVSAAPEHPAAGAAEHSAAAATPAGLLAQLRGRYLLVDQPEELLVLDQHAVGEHVCFAQARSELERHGHLTAQRLLFPVVVSTTAPLVRTVERFTEAIEGLGFDLRPAGEQAVAIHAVARAFSRGAPEPLAELVLAELARRGDDERARPQLLAKLACRCSPQHDAPLSPAEAAALVEHFTLLSDAGDVRLCEPVLLRIRYADLRRQAEHQPPA